MPNIEGIKNARFNAGKSRKKKLSAKIMMKKN
jgi:hypothetical protein